ncbi:hypothetical protein SPV1_13362 [Mariprofundus ferrooxydans PV-1]|uniref:Uncharacterized protein n=1 Tax=Mariprofundus ferrooxydans PV-1 TaxID=314345 RepID=Q0EXC7_9PROT|nr:hypothetical protein SPV1_13362 [Mariprofundus ferrooxydans PV-1]
MHFDICPDGVSFLNSSSIDDRELGVCEDLIAGR